MKYTTSNIVHILYKMCTTGKIDTNKVKSIYLDSDKTRPQIIEILYNLNIQGIEQNMNRKVIIFIITNL